MPRKMLEVQYKTKDLDDLVRNHDDLLANNVYVNLGRSHGRFRKDWLRRLKTTVGTGTGRIARQFFYVRSSTLGGRYKADRLRSTFYTTSRVALGLQEGGLQRPKGGGRMAIPIGYALTSAGRVKKAYKNASNKMSDLVANKALIVKRSRQPGSLLVYEVLNAHTTRRRREGSQAFQRHGKGLQKARLIYVLVRGGVRRRPQLNFFESWKQHEPIHLLRMSQSIDATLRGIYLK